MLDSLVLHIPLQSEFYTVNGHLHSIIGDIADYQVRAVPSYLKRDPVTKEVTLGDLYSPFESLPTSFSSMAMKFYAVNVANTPPYVAINASAKLLQGHNVYGGESVLNLASEMLALLKENYPFFYDTLDIRAARISRIDSTYSVRLSSERLIQPALRFLKNADTGQRKADNRRDFHNTVYFGLANSPYGGAKIYGKAYELKETIKKYERAATRGNTQAVKMLDIFNDELVQYSQGLLRFECTTKARQLEKCNIPKNLWGFIDHQLHDDRNVLTKLWRMWFDPILSTLKGDIMPDIDDSNVYAQCQAKLFSYTSKGNVSYAKANTIYNFYKLLKQDGYELVKERHTTPTFNRNIKALVDLGFPLASLKNLSKETLPTVPVRELVTLDFKGQYPADYKPVKSKHIKDYTKYIKSDNIGSLMFPKLYGVDGQLLPLPEPKKAKYS